jgi:ABC-type glycerol-3-phosphate transport system substrate-binding protein
MTARWLLILALGLAALTAGAILWQPAALPPGKTRLVWTSDNSPARFDQIDAFNREHPDLVLTLDFANNSSTGTDKTILQCSSGVGPDVLDIYGPDAIQTYAEAGVLLDLTGTAERMGFSATTDSWPAATEAVTVFGRQYAYACQAGVPILIYNKNIFDYFHVPYPQGRLTWEQFIDLAQRVSSHPVPGSNSQPLIFGIGNLNWHGFFASGHGEFFDEKGNLKLLGNAALRQAFQMHKDFVFKYHIMPTTIDMNAMSGQGGWSAGYTNQFALGRFAMISEGDWSIVSYRALYRLQMAQLKAAGKKPEDIADPLQRPLRLGCTLVPGFAGQPPCYQVEITSAAINSRSTHVREADSFLQYLSGQTYSALINHAADYLPGNPRYADFGVQAESPDLARLEMHEATKAGMAYGYLPRRSHYILTTDVTRVLDDEISRLESDPSLNIDDLIQTAQLELEKLMWRNIERDPQLETLYRRENGLSATARLHD